MDSCQNFLVGDIDWDKWEEAYDEESAWAGKKILPKKHEFLFLHTFFVHNWFSDNKALRKQLEYYMALLDKGKKINDKEYKIFLEKAQSAYEKKVKTISKRLSWLNDIDKKTLVILTSDHAEIFSNPGSFRHGNYAINNRQVFLVPLLVKENITSKKTVVYYQYDYLLPKFIFNKLGKPYESTLKQLVRTTLRLNQENLILRNDLRDIHASKIWRFHHYYKKMSNFPYIFTLFLFKKLFILTQYNFKKILRFFRVI